MIQKQELTTIIEETVSETVKDITTLAEIIRLVANVTLDVTALLSRCFRQ